MNVCIENWEPVLNKFKRVLNDNSARNLSLKLIVAQ